MPQQAQDPVAAIEAMLAKGMGEEEIIATMGGKPAAPAPTPYDRLMGGSAMGAQKMGPRPPENKLLGFAKEFMGIADPTRMTTDEEQGSFPIPFTHSRLKPGDAAMGAMSLAGMGSFAKQLPAFARGVLEESAPRAISGAGQSLPRFSPPPGLPPQAPKLPNFQQPVYPPRFPAPPTSKLVRRPQVGTVEDVIADILKQLHGK